MHRVEKKMRIAVLFGGQSGEHEISLRSAEGVLSHLDKNKYELTCIGIARDGRWFLQDNLDISDIRKGLKMDDTRLIALLPGQGLLCNGQFLPIDFILPILHGTYCEDGILQGLLESLHLPYMGTGVLGSALGMDKRKAKELWQQAGLPVVPFLSCGKSMLRDAGEFSKCIHAIENEFSYPVFVKPVCSGSSVGASEAHKREDLENGIREAFRFDLNVMIEPCIDGREIECAVIGNAQARAFLPGEIEPKHEFYDYKAKYIDPDGAVLLIPAPLDKTMSRLVQDTAVKAYQAVCAEGLARVDFFLEKSSGRLLLNEINTLPGFTNISMFAMLCEAGGLTYPDLLDRLIQLGLERYQERSTLVTEL